jgi:serine-type D-Ala-D-Ala carboxypeptidase/endopeptidase (penicillin-binding protein 4)
MLCYQFMRRTRNCLSSIPLIIFIFLSACAHPHGEGRLIRGPSKGDPVAELRLQLDRLFSAATFDNAFWGVAIRSLDTEQVLYEQNSRRLLMPASNMKLLTAVAALKKLGPQFTYQTQLETNGEIQNGVLNGNLIVIGNGDPTISARFGEGDPYRIFNQWAARLKEIGINKIHGDIIGIDDAFDDERIGYGWSWDDLPYYYATEISALQFAENAFTVTISSVPSQQQIEIKKEPDTSYVTVVTNINVDPVVETSVKWSYQTASRTVYATGTLKAGGSDYGSFAINNPSAYFVTALKESLQRYGIEVDGEAYRGRDRNFKVGDSARLLFTQTSPPLRKIVSVLLKVSQNLYAETLLKTLGAGNFSNGVKQVEETLTNFGVTTRGLIMKDGSGLSRYNYISPEALLNLLKHMFRDQEFDNFYNALSVAGVDGTLRSRLKGTIAENNVHAKTGSIANVRSLSGYLHTRDNEMIAFVIIANNYSVDDDQALAIEDHALQLLANFTRKPNAKNQ